MKPKFKVGDIIVRIPGAESKAYFAGPGQVVEVEERFPDFWHYQILWKIEGKKRRQRSRGTAYWADPQYEVAVVKREFLYEAVDYDS